MRQLFISCFESVSFIHDLISVQSCLLEPLESIIYQKFALSLFYLFIFLICSLITGCKTLSHTISISMELWLYSFRYSFSGEVWNWANNGGTGSQNALCSYNAWSCKKIEVNVSIKHCMQEILRSWNVSWMYTRKLTIEIIEVQIKIYDDSYLMTEIKTMNVPGSIGYLPSEIYRITIFLWVYCSSESALKLMSLETWFDQYTK